MAQQPNTGPSKSAAPASLCAADPSPCLSARPSPQCCCPSPAACWHRSQPDCTVSADILHLHGFGKVGPAPKDLARRLAAIAVLQPSVARPPAGAAVCMPAASSVGAGEGSIRPHLLLHCERHPAPAVTEVGARAGVSRGQRLLGWDSVCCTCACFPPRLRATSKNTCSDLEKPPQIKCLWIHTRDAAVPSYLED